LIRGLHGQVFAICYPAKEAGLVLVSDLAHSPKSRMKHRLQETVAIKLENVTQEMQKEFLKF
jgi:hypothetical protein